jgi:hypothetical protein
MKIFNKAKILLLLVVVLLTSCNRFTSSPAISSTSVMKTAKAHIETAIVETQTAIPASTSTDTPLPAPTSLPPTHTSTPMPQNSPIPVSGTPTIIAMENGLTWVECIAPIEDYAHSVEDQEFASRCLNMEIPVWDDNDRKMAGEWTVIATVTSNNNAVFQQVVGNDVYLIKQEGTNGCCEYEFLKNGKVILKTHIPLVAASPFQHHFTIDGKAVWELLTDPPTILVDGVDYNEKHQLEGIFKPYAIRNKLIYIAKQNGKYHIVYDEEIIGPEYDEIYIKYCCGTTNVRYGKGQYLFWGKRDGTYYVVGIR